MNPIAQMLQAQLLGGFGTMQNLGNQIGNQFSFANLLNSMNRQASYPAQAQIATEQMRNQRFNAALPAIMQALSGGGGGGGLQGFQTNYGAGASIGGSQAPPSQTGNFNAPKKAKPMGYHAGVAKLKGM